MSTKDNDKTKQPPSKSTFDDFEENFFSTEVGTAKAKLSKSSDEESDEDSSEDFGYSGEIESVEMPLDDGHAATDIFNRAAYDELLDELDGQGDIGEALEESSDDSPPLELVSNFRMKSKTKEVDPGVMDNLLQEFSEEFGEPLTGDSSLGDVVNEGPRLQDDLLDMAFDDLDLEPVELGSEVNLQDMNLNLGERIELDEESAEFLNEVRDEVLSDERSSQGGALEDDSTDLLGTFSGTEQFSPEMDAESVWGDQDDSDAGGLDSLAEDTFDGWVDSTSVTYKPTGEQEYYQRLRSLFLQEAKLASTQQDKQYLWAECARISSNVLREDETALDLFAKANDGENGILRNADLKQYADVAARHGQTRLYLDVLQ